MTDGSAPAEDVDRHGPGPSPAPGGGGRASRVGRRAAAPVAVVALLAIAGLSLVDPASPPNRSPDPRALRSPTPTVRATATPVGSVPTSSPAAPGRAVVDVPDRIDRTGASDVTDELQGVLDDAPDGTTIRLSQDAMYRVDGTLELTGRHDLVIDGRGATLHPTTVSDDQRRTWSLVRSSDVRLTDMTIVGTHPDGGTYVPAHEHEHGFGIEGGGDVTIERVTITAVYGDCVYVTADEDGAWADGVRFLDSSCEETGRNGVAIVAGRNVEIARSTFVTIARFPLDIEPNQSSPPQGASGIAFHDSRIQAPIGDYVVAANGWGPVDHLTVADNIVSGIPFRLAVQPIEGSGYRRSAISVTGNRSDTAEPDGGPVMAFRDNDDLVVTGNVQPFEEDGLLALVAGSCRAVVDDNDVSGATQSLVLSPRCL